MQRTGIFKNIKIKGVIKMFRPFDKFLKNVEEIVKNAEEEMVMEEKRITEEQFDKAVIDAMEAFTDDERLGGTAKLMVPLTGAMFASKMREFLFGENKEEK
jgi:lipoate-protein ligase A